MVRMPDGGVVRVTRNGEHGDGQTKAGRRGIGEAKRAQAGRRENQTITAIDEGQSLTRRTYGM